MAIELATKVNVDPPSGPWPFGMTKDNTGSGNGTPLNHAVMSDYFQFFAKMFYESGLTFNGLVDNATNTFQYYNALKAVTNQYKGINSYSTATALTDDDYGAFSVMDVNGDFDFTLPALAVPTVKQKMVLMKLQGGVCKVLPNGTDTITPSAEINLRGGDVIVMVSFGFGWLVESHYRFAEKPVVAHSTATVSLSEKHLGCLNIVNFFGAATYTLPPIAGSSSGQIIILQKQQPGILSVIPNGTDTIYPSDALDLDDGDIVVLESIIGVHWMVISRFDASQFAPVEAWHQVGAVGEPAFQGGWGNVPASSTCEFKKIGNTVYVRGTVTTSINAPSIFLLPAGYTPSQLQYSTANEVGTATAEQIRIDTGGIVVMMSGNPLGRNFGLSFQFITD